jgi:hypothetical protein
MLSVQIRIRLVFVALAVALDNMKAFAECFFGGHMRYHIADVREAINSTVVRKSVDLCPK